MTSHSKQIIGISCAIGAAVCYGTNNFGAVNLRNLGMEVPSVLFYRFGLAWLIIAAIVLFKTITGKESLKVTRREFATLSTLGVLFIFSSLSLYLSFNYMDSGIASTILFTYPVMTATIMTIFFRERVTFSTVSSILLSLGGVLLLNWGGTGGTLNTFGVILVLISALTYALYIIVVDKSPLRMSSFKINFYVLFYCALGMALFALVSGHPLTFPVDNQWFYVSWLALVPAIMALVMMVYAAKFIGSTPTAILGALEPTTAVLIGVFVFNEAFTVHLLFGIVLILAAVVIVVLGKGKKTTIQ